MPRQQQKQQKQQKQQQQHALWLQFFKCMVLTTVVIIDAVSLTSTTTKSSKISFFVEGRPNFPNIVTIGGCGGGGGGTFSKLASSSSFRIFRGRRGGGDDDASNNNNKNRRQQQHGGSIRDISLTSSSSSSLSSSSSSEENTTTSRRRRTFLSLASSLKPTSNLNDEGRQQQMGLLATSTSTSAEQETTTKSRRNYNNNNNSIFDNIKEDVRGGASVAARQAAKTMSARKMETFKFLSGGVAGTVAACITNPLEVIKTQMQSSNKELSKAKGHPVEIAKTIMEADGFSGFFRGLPPTLIGIIPSRSAYFYAYQRIRSLLNPTLPEGSPPNALIAGFMAGIVGNTLTNPIWMVRTRMQLLIDHTAGQRAYNGYGDAIMTIFKEEGLGGFYKGITASYWGCAEGALQFIIYEQIKAKLIDRQNNARAAKGLKPTSELPKSTYFWAAAASKCVAAIATYPHEVARTRMREQARSGIFKYKGMWQTIGLMSKEEGLKSLYSGMGVHLVKVVPNSALMFLTYEVVRSWLDGYEIVENRTLEGSDD